VFDIPAVDDPRIMVTIPVPVKGRKTPLVLRLPRFDFLDEDQHDAMSAATEKVAEESADLPARKQQRLFDLAMLKPHVAAKDWPAVEALPVGPLNAIVGVWAEQSNIPLGEFLASADSSTENTEAPSSTTSTPEDGQEETSDAA
jgi:hypothetical protein